MREASAPPTSSPDNPTSTRPALSGGRVSLKNNPYTNIPREFHRHLRHPGSIGRVWGPSVPKDVKCDGLIICDFEAPHYPDEEQEIALWYVRLFIFLERTRGWGGILEFGPRGITLHIFIKLVRGDEQSFFTEIKSLSPRFIGMRADKSLHKSDRSYFKGLEHPFLLLGDGLRQRDKWTPKPDTAPLWMRLFCELSSKGLWKDEEVSEETETEPLDA
jgi:hypothetical protein